MMRKIGLTQRVEVVADYGERRDCLDQAWHPLLHDLGYASIPLPNLADTQQAKALLSAIDLDGVILSGGNDLALTNGTNIAPERDAFEATLIDWAKQQNIPILGVCRGMQMLHHHAGGILSPVTGHVAPQQTVISADQIQRQVNSYHNWGIQADALLSDFKALACAEDGTIECMQHRTDSITAMMWHPERDHVDLDWSKSIIQETFQ